MFSVNQTLTKLWGRHQLKVGGEFGYNLFAQGLAREGANVGAFNFTRNYTSNNPGGHRARSPTAAQGNAFASFLHRLPAQPDHQPGGGARSALQRRAIPGVYVQDDWRLSDRFTINLGLRYDFETSGLRA